MPKKHQVPSLRDLALRSVSEFVTAFGKQIVGPITVLTALDSKKGHAYLRTSLLSMRQHLCINVPWHLYDRMALEILRAIRNLINEIKSAYTDRSTMFSSEINVAVNLTRVIVHPNLKRIEFSIWPKIMRHALYDSLVDMTGLEVLDLGSGSVGWKTSDIEKIIVNAISKMKNLTSFTLCFDCTDNVLAAVCQNCPKLQKLDVTASRSVTDRSISSLLKCQQLREIKLLSTSVSVPGYANLLLNHSCLEDIGRYDEWGIALEYIQHSVDNFDKPFQLRSFECRNMNTQQLYLLVEMCPYISSLSMMRDERIEDLAILASLTELKELKLLSCDFYANGVQLLLEIIGCNIVSLHLEHVGEIDLSALVYISQFCPNLRSLVFYNCEFLAVASTRHRKLQVPPFKHLERLKCVVDCADAHLEFILSHCTNIKFIHLGSSTGIGDATICRVFSKNRMTKLEELKILYSTDLSMASVHLLMQNCENLRRLSELESWDGISPQELDAFREQLRINNVDLDTSPTLSLA
ncbi:SCF E3 ubiquitin ligase complex F-box protein grrA-like [Nasonia vitripennis]|uniref:Uncharacterized protein n=1 Tax=Nasonia vitripennis TaxID=7425 RepID=A0A7M7QNI9_NASVI|nr:SCF E3 ubiquitin ligase complex F-box protein grrA-like [Nasonia vitripennis]XP_032452370.1 SCF E3 ubiquitin ligase complex F-box protein grrA-like [Nasonia vitripennis]XP_032452371.1 SCF E3 ubiquitin ligase complex F-box protein grrA-like [Nasonia vitripennis]XP_032452372.1 SCF E3 ubiquitin ligase complex F-box protein grrA-like [Nasonia vitripennis]XP_032452373.1 SCF E3 ubiquitin ligase complex F-box protein grrA-like [Nasonia vitripennis]XP_032452374.1 SCF E3 ubiquitin ligase complex F-b